MKRYLTYLANPYSLVIKPEDAWKADESQVKQYRFEIAAKAASYLMQKYDWNVFSPIVHSHPLHTIAGMRGDWKFWCRVDTEYLNLSCRMVVLCLSGWKDSVGVLAEIKIAKRLKVPVRYMNPVTLELTNAAPVYE